jgi:DNA-binding NtrC family response regulator
VAVIAIYEEDELMRALLKEWLSGAGYRVGEATPGAVSLGGGKDLVIASVCTPKGAGEQLLQEVQAAHPHTPLIAISGQFRSGLSAAGTIAHMLDVQRILAKPLTCGDLLQAVRAIIGAPSRGSERTECPH